MRKALIGGAFAATLLACYFAPDDEGDVIAPASARTHITPAQATAVEPEPATPALDIHPRLASDDLGNAFAKQTWQQETPKKLVLAQAEVQARQAGEVQAARAGAPPLPIRFLGRYVEDGKVAYFLQLGERNVVAHAGDQVDDNYRFDGANGGTLTFTYLPLHQQQTLPAGDTN